MKILFNSEIEKLASGKGIFNLLDKKRNSLFIGVAENLKDEIKKTFKNHNFLYKETTKIKIIETEGEDLVKLFAHQIRQNKPLYNFSIAEENLYPHIKITNEEFPRLLAARRIFDDGAEYFGAFLPDTKVRFLLGFLIDAFRLRGCDIPLDGSFLVPCPQYFRRKCLAPCVENLCDEGKYLEFVDYARLFLQNKTEKLNDLLLEKINILSEKLDFETATKWRDFKQSINDFQADKQRQFRIDDASDSFDIKINDSKILISLVTRKNRKILGTRVFGFENEADFTSAEILQQILWQFYQFHTPGEISVSTDFQSRKFLEKTLSRRAGKTIKISIFNAKNQKKTVNKAFQRGEHEHKLENIKPILTASEIQNKIQKEFNLREKPFRIEAFDVAHISGVDFVGAKSAWENGIFKTEKYEFWFLDEKNELEAMAKTLENRFQNDDSLPDLIVIDGARSQLSAALKSLNKQNGARISIISAVKPSQRHNEISYFLKADGEKVSFKLNADEFNVLLKLRDEAHELANYVHRTKRETTHFYELFQATPFLSENERYFLLRKFGTLKELKKKEETEFVKLFGKEKGRLIFQNLKKEFVKIQPFIVPIRYNDLNSGAEDLRPLFSANNKLSKNLDNSALAL